MLGDRIWQARERRGMNQEQLAAAAGIRQGHISRLESGDLKDIRGETLVKIARALGVTTDYLLGLSDELPEGETLPPTRRRRRRAAVR
jgi:transcriptional regulator with XRE-family HTH domain